MMRKRVNFSSIISTKLEGADFVFQHFNYYLNNAISETVNDVEENPTSPNYTAFLHNENIKLLKEKCQNWIFLIVVSLSQELE